MIFDSRNSLQRSFGHSAMRRIPYASGTCNILTFSPLGNENVTPKNVLILLPPANDVCEGYVFTGVCLPTGGTCVVGGGGLCGECRGYAWQGGMCGGEGGWVACVAEETATASYWNAFLLLHFFNI